MAAGTSMILMSATRHCTPNAPEPSFVIRSTTCPAGSDGGMIGAGGGVCAIASIAIVNVVSTIAPAMTSRICPSRWYVEVKTLAALAASRPRGAAVVNKQGLARNGRQGLGHCGYKAITSQILA